MYSILLFIVFQFFVNCNFRFFCLKHKTLKIYISNKKKLASSSRDIKLICELKDSIVFEIVYNEIFVQCLTYLPLLLKARLNYCSSVK